MWTVVPRQCQASAEIDVDETKCQWSPLNGDGEVGVGVLQPGGHGVAKIAAVREGCRPR